MTKDNFGVWEVTLPGKDGTPAIPHNSKIKVFAARLLSTIPAFAYSLGLRSQWLPRMESLSTDFPRGSSESYRT